MRKHVPLTLLLIFWEILLTFGAGNPADSFYILQVPDSVEKSSLPVIKINTERRIRDKKRIAAQMEILNAANENHTQGSDSSNNYSGTIKIEVRGSSSEAFPKKSYSIQTLDTAGNAINVSLLGLPAESDWILYAPYNDKSLIRDVVAYKIGRDLNRFTIQTLFVELFLNEEYQGIYVLEEKIKLSRIKVNTSEACANECPAPMKSDGFILRIDKPKDANRNIDRPTLVRIIWKTKNILLNEKQKKPDGTIIESDCVNGRKNYFRSVYLPVDSKWQRIKFNYYDPKPEELTNQDRVDICESIHTMETSLLEPFALDSDSGYHKYLDMESFIDFFILNEVSKNIDAYRLSTYFFKNSDSGRDQLFMGPPWDFNISMGNADYCEGYLTTGWAFEYNKICPNDAWLVPFWWQRLLEDPLFRDHLKCRWLSLRNTTLATHNLMQDIDSISGSLKEAPYRNFKRWKTLGKRLWPNKYVFTTYPEEVAYLKSWLTQRLEWLDQNMPGDCSQQSMKIKN